MSHKFCDESIPGHGLGKARAQQREMPIQISPPPVSMRPVAKQGSEITGWRIRMYYWTRNPHVLFWVAMIILGIGVLLGHQLQGTEGRSRLAVMMEKFRKELHEHYGGGVETGPVELGPELLKSQPEFARVLAALAQRPLGDAAAAADVREAMQASKMTATEKGVALAYWESLCSGLGEPSAELLYLAHRSQPAPRANELAADFHAQNPGKLEKALSYYERELAAHPNAEFVRKKLVALHWAREDFASLKKLHDDPAYHPHFTAQMKLETAMRQHDWGAVWAPLVEMQKSNFSQRIPLILTGVAGAVWLILAWQMAQPTSFVSFRILAPLVALPLGAASTLPVLFLDVYQSEAWGLKETGFFLDDCLFFVAGVGVREELCKFLLFLPLVPVLLWRGSRLEMVVVAGCVGLGFAVEENISYFRMAEPANAFGRFLTANFFHFAATGLIGLAFCDTVRDFARKWWKFPVVFIGVSAAHGFYDAFGQVPHYVFIALGLSCFILLSLGFFREVARERGAATDQIFPAATLIVGLSVLVATIIICASLEYGLAFALESVAISGVTLAIFIYMFFVLFRDGLGDDEEQVVPNYEPY